MRAGRAPACRSGKIGKTQIESATLAPWFEPVLTRGIASVGAADGGAALGERLSSGRQLGYLEGPAVLTRTPSFGPAHLCAPETRVDTARLFDGFLTAPLKADFTRLRPGIRRLAGRVAERRWTFATTRSECQR